MTLHKAFRYRLYPNQDQSILIQKTFGCCRFIYNKMLKDKIEYYAETKEMLKNTPAQYKDEFEWLKEVDSYALCNELLNLRAAFMNFFKRPNIGFPKFKSKKFDKKSYKTTNVNHIIRIEKQNLVHLPKLGNVRFVEHRRIPKNHIIKSAIISQTASGKYYISILTEYDVDIPDRVLDPNNAIGLDYSTPEFYIDNQGNNPEGFVKLFKKTQPKLAKEQRKLSRMKLHSNNYEKQKIKVARIHEKSSNQRKDFIEKESTKLSRSYDVVCIEDINLRDQAQSLHLGKSTNDNGFGMFRVKLQQKLEIQGKKLIKINKWQPTSTICSHCGTYHKDIVNSLSVREWTCPDCGTHHDRDTNAAKNILIQGLKSIQ